jgi:uncharacterized Zn-binding protein involved in type VI secretion
MPVAARLNDPTAPHDCWSGGNLSSGSGNVLINGIPAARVSDSGTTHIWICPGSGSHANVVSAGSGSVVINGLAAARMGDPMDCGSVITAGSSNVIIGG